MAKTEATRCDRCGKQTIGLPAEWGVVRMGRTSPFLATGDLDLCPDCFSHVYDFVRKPAMDPPMTAAFKEGAKTKPSGMVHVHSDGGSCHGMRILVNGKCSGCGISPDLQSTGLWPTELVKG